MIKWLVCDNIVDKRKQPDLSIVLSFRRGNNGQKMQLVKVVCRIKVYYEKIMFLPRDASAERGDATVSCLSVCLSVRNDQVPWSHTLEYFENNFTAK